MDLESLKYELAGLPFSNIFFYLETDSTNQRAIEWLQEGKAGNALFTADSQTAGRGRLGRKWHTEPGASLAFSLALHPTKDEKDKLSLFPLLGAVAAAEAAEKVCRSPVEVKWPNDVLLNGKKTCGILAETVWQGEELAGLVLGIGINLLPTSVPPAQELNFPATCIQVHATQTIDRLFFLRSVITHLFNYRNTLTQDSFIQRYRDLLAFKNQEVMLETMEGKKFCGILDGIDNGGCLLLKMDESQTKSFPIGDLRLRPA